MALTAVGIAVVAGTAAASGYQAKRGHDQAVQARHEVDEEKRRQFALAGALSDKEKANRALAGQQQALQRRRALAMTRDDRYGTIKTSPSGVPAAQPSVGGNTVLGAA